MGTQLSALPGTGNFLYESLQDNFVRFILDNDLTKFSPLSDKILDYDRDVRNVVFLTECSNQWLKFWTLQNTFVCMFGTKSKLEKENIYGHLLYQQSKCLVIIVKETLISETLCKMDSASITTTEDLLKLLLSLIPSQHSSAKKESHSKIQKRKKLVKPTPVQEREAETPKTVKKRKRVVRKGKESSNTSLIPESTQKETTREGKPKNSPESAKKRTPRRIKSAVKSAESEKKQEKSATVEEKPVKKKSKAGKSMKKKSEPEQSKKNEETPQEKKKPVKKRKSAISKQSKKIIEAQFENVVVSEQKPKLLTEVKEEDMDSIALLEEELNKWDLSKKMSIFDQRFDSEHREKKKKRVDVSQPVYARLMIRSHMKRVRRPGYKDPDEAPAVPETPPAAPTPPVVEEEEKEIQPVPILKKHKKKSPRTKFQPPPFSTHFSGIEVVTPSNKQDESDHNTESGEDVWNDKEFNFENIEAIPAFPEDVSDATFDDAQLDEFMNQLAQETIIQSPSESKNKTPNKKRKISFVLSNKSDSSHGTMDSDVVERLKDCLLDSSDINLSPVEKATRDGGSISSTGSPMSPPRTSSRVETSEASSRTFTSGGLGVFSTDPGVQYPSSDGI